MAEVLSDKSVEIALGGSYYAQVLASSPLGFWLLNEQLAASVARNAVPGATVEGTFTGGGLTFGHQGPFPHGGTAVRFEGLSYVTMGDVAAFEFTGAFSIECMFRTSATTGANHRALISKCDVNFKGWSLVSLPSAGGLYFSALTAAGATVFGITAPSDYNDDLWHHVACSWDGTTGANGVTMYVDGGLVVQGTANAGTPDANAGQFRIGAFTSDPESWIGDIAGVAVYNTFAIGGNAAANHYNATQWTDVTDDVLLSEHLTLEYGTFSSGPKDRLANVGTLDFALDNSPKNQAGLIGRYSPLHDNCLAGFTFDIPVRVQMVYDGTTYTKFWGRIASIDPQPGVDGSQLTRVIANDYAYTLVNADLREVTPQIDQTDRDLILTVFEAMSPLNQPMAIDLDASIEQYLYAFDDIQGGVKVATALNKILQSGWSKAFIQGDGTFRWLNRLATTNQSIDFPLEDTELLELSTPSDRSDRFDRIRTITHPKYLDTVDTSVIFTHPNATSTPPSTVLVPANGGTLVIWPQEGYKNPDNTKVTIGATDQQTPTATTDYVANSAADGSGSNLTGDVTVDADFFASTVKLTLTNTHATLPAYFTKLQVRGRGIYDLAPVTSEAIGTPGTRPLTIDLPYQHDGNIGQDLADFILNEREAITDPVENLVADSHLSQKLMELSLAEPGQLVTVTEQQTGLFEAQAAIRSVRLVIDDNDILTATMGLLPIVVGYLWVLDDPIGSVLDETTVFG